MSRATLELEISQTNGSRCFAGRGPFVRYGQTRSGADGLRIFRMTGANVLIAQSSWSVA